MLREELDFYIMKFVDEDEGGGSARNLFSLMRSSLSSRNSVGSLKRRESVGSIGDAAPNLAAYGPQVKQVVQEFFKTQLKVQTMADFSPDAKPPTGTLPGSSSFSRLYVCKLME
jgi:hypothetical protein